MPILSFFQTPQVDAAAGAQQERPYPRSQLYRLLARQLYPDWPSLLLAALAGLSSALALLLAPLFLSRSLDLLGELASGQDRAAHSGLSFLARWQLEDLPQLSLWLLGLYLGYALSVYLMRLLLEGLLARLGQRLRQAGFEQLQAITVVQVRRRPEGDVLLRLTGDVDQLVDGLRQTFVQIFTGLPLLLGALVLLLRLSLWAALLTLFLSPLGFWLSSFISRRSGRYFSSQASALAAVNSRVDEDLRAWQLLRVFGASPQRLEAFAERSATLYEQGWRAQFYSALVNPAARFVNNVSYLLTALLAALLVLAGQFSIGLLTAVLSYTLQFGKPINEISGVIGQLQNGLASAERIFHFLEEPPKVEAQKVLQLRRGDIDFCHLDFAYEPGRPLMRDVNIHCPAGTVTAIVGPTGAGKTTLVNLLLRFYEPQGGCIRIDGQDIRDCSRASLRRHIGMVLQDARLFEGSVRDNIAVGRPGASLEEVQAAARASLAQHFIERLPQGYDTVLHNGGEGLSAGQKQLITVARMFLMAPRILILDEATSALDSRSEALVQEAFKRLVAGRTCFVIAHRLSTVRQADQILVMDGGQVLEQGSHEELLAAGGLYRELYDSQYEAAAGLSPGTPPSAI